MWYSFENRHDSRPLEECKREILKQNWWRKQKLRQISLLLRFVMDGQTDNNPTPVYLPHNSLRGYTNCVLVLKLIGWGTCIKSIKLQILDQNETKKGQQNYCGMCRTPQPSNQLEGARGWGPFGRSTTGRWTFWWSARWKITQGTILQTHISQYKDISH